MTMVADFNHHLSDNIQEDLEIDDELLKPGQSIVSKPRSDDPNKSVMATSADQKKAPPRPGSLVDITFAVQQLEK